MYTTIHWVAGVPSGALGTMARPRGGDWLEVEIAHYRREDVSLVVSALSPSEERELDLLSEAAECARAGIAWRRLVIPDRGVPESTQSFVTLTAEVAAHVTGGGRVAMHCRQGIGRASMLAVGTLMAMSWTSEQAWDAVASARGRAIPDTPEQRAWVDALVF